VNLFRLLCDSRRVSARQYAKSSRFSDVFPSLRIKL